MVIKVVLLICIVMAMLLTDETIPVAMLIYLVMVILLADWPWNGWLIFIGTYVANLLK